MTGIGNPVASMRAAEHFARLNGRAPEFGPVRTEEELAAAEAAMGLRLPEDVRALHLLVRDDRRENGLLGRCHLQPLPTVVEDYSSDMPGSWAGEEDLFVPGRVVPEADPTGVVRRVSRNDWWVAVASDHAGNSLAVDLDPGPTGGEGISAASWRVCRPGTPLGTPCRTGGRPWHGRGAGRYPGAADVQLLYLNDADSPDLRVVRDALDWTSWSTTSSNPRTAG